MSGVYECRDCGHQGVEADASTDRCWCSFCEDDFSMTGGTCPECEQDMLVSACPKCAGEWLACEPDWIGT